MIRHRGWNETSCLVMWSCYGSAASWMWPRLWTDGFQYSTERARKLGSRGAWKSCDQGRASEIRGRGWRDLLLRAG